MVGTFKKADKNYEPTNEERAFVYQQVLELKPMLYHYPDPITVIVTKNLKKSKNKYSVTFILVPSKLNIRIHSSGNDLFDVCMNVKNKSQKAIHALSHQIENPVRNLQMEYYKSFPYMH